jgi:hypothetical protein
MRRRVDSVDEPGLGTHDRGDPEGQVLGQLEGLEVVEDDRFVEPLFEGLQGAAVEKHGVAAEPGAEPCDGGRSAADGTGNLTVGRAGQECGGDGSQQLGSLEVVGEREGLAREGLAATLAEVSLDREPAGGGVGAGEAPSKPGGIGVTRATVAGAEGGSEILQSIDGSARPAHASL